MNESDLLGKDEYKRHRGTCRTFDLGSSNNDVRKHPRSHAKEDEKTPGGAPSGGARAYAPLSDFFLVRVATAPDSHVPAAIKRVPAAW